MMRPNYVWRMGAGTLILLTLAEFLGNQIWWLGLTGHFRPHLLIALIFWLTISYFLKNTKIWITALWLSILVNLFYIWPTVAPFPLSNKISAETPPIKIMHLNTNRGAADLSILDTQTADILFLQEVTPESAEKLDQIQEMMPIKVHAMHNTHGSAMLIQPSLVQHLRQTEIIHLPAQSTRPLMTALFDFEDQSVRLLSLHTTRPRNPQTDHFQQIEFDSVGQWAIERQAAGETVIIIGDFNTTPWAQRERNFVKKSGLTYGKRGLRLHNSWPGGIFRWVGLPIDQAVFTPNINLEEKQVHSVKQSDHALLSIKVSLTPD